MVADTKYYDLLGITPDATPEEIKKAYRRQSMKYHPDRTDGDPDKETLFISIKNAYEVLIDEATRAKYDENGASVGHTPLQLEAKGILSTLFAQAIENMINNKQSMAARYSISNVLTTVKDIMKSVEKNKSRLMSTLIEIKEQRRKLTDCMDAVEYDGKGEDLFHKVLSDMFRQCESAVKQAEHQIDVNNEVMTLLEHYHDKPEEVMKDIEFKPEPIENDISPTWRL